MWLCTIQLYTLVTFMTSQTHLSLRAHVYVMGLLGFVSLDINQLSLPTPFYSALGVYFCLYGPFNCISFLKFSFSPDIIPST